MGHEIFKELEARSEALADLRAFAAWDGQLLAAPDQPEPEADRFDADSFADALYGECFNAKADWLPVLGEKTAEDLNALPAPALLAVLLDDGQQAITRCAAADVLAVRFGVRA